MYSQEFGCGNLLNSNPIYTVDITIPPASSTISKDSVVSFTYSPITETQWATVLPLFDSQPKLKGIYAIT